MFPSSLPCLLLLLTAPLLLVGQIQIDEQSTFINSNGNVPTSNALFVRAGVSNSFSDNAVINKFYPGVFANTGQVFSTSQIIPQFPFGIGYPNVESQQANGTLRRNTFLETQRGAFAINRGVDGLLGSLFRYGPNAGYGNIAPGPLGGGAGYGIGTGHGNPYYPYFNTYTSPFFPNGFQTGFPYYDGRNYYNQNLGVYGGIPTSGTLLNRFLDRSGNRHYEVFQTQRALLSGVGTNVGKGANRQTGVQNHTVVNLSINTPAPISLRRSRRSYALAPLRKMLKVEFHPPGV